MTWVELKEAMESPMQWRGSRTGWVGAIQQSESVVSRCHCPEPFWQSLACSIRLLPERAGVFWSRVGLNPWACHSSSPGSPRLPVYEMGHRKMGWDDKGILLMEKAQGSLLLRSQLQPVGGGVEY